MNVLKWTIGGVIGGLMGAGIWAAVGHYSGYEVGWIAWGIGFLVGFGVRAAAQEDDGFGPGVVATAIAIGAVLLGKYLVISWSVSGLTDSIAEMEVTDANMIASIANDIAEERENAGKKIAWPENVADDAPGLAHYPIDIQQEATKQWNDVPADEKKTRVEERQQELATIAASLGATVKGNAFRESFAAWDLLWLGLAAFTAFKLGSGLETGE